MTAEQIVMRQEIRQMLNEVGINRNTLKDMAKEVLHEELEKACKQALQEFDVDGRVNKIIDNSLDRKIELQTRDVIQRRVWSVFDRMKISVDITDNKGQSSLEK